MTSIIGKTIKGQTYYYSREVARFGGKPKIISQTYLGKAADIEAAVAGATSMPDRSRHLAFGDVAAVWEMLRRLHVAEIVDEVVGARRSDAGASVGTYIALALSVRLVVATPSGSKGTATRSSTRRPSPVSSRSRPQRSSSAPSGASFAVTRTACTTSSPGALPRPLQRHTASSQQSRTVSPVAGAESQERRSRPRSLPSSPRAGCHG